MMSTDYNRCPKMSTVGGGTSGELALERLERVDVVARAAVADVLGPDQLRARVHRAQRDVGAAGRAPLLHLLRPRLARRGEVDHRLDAEIGVRAALLLEPFAQAREQSEHPRRCRAEQESIARACGAAQRHGRGPAEADRNLPRGVWQEAGGVDAVEVRGDGEHGSATGPAQAL